MTDKVTKPKQMGGEVKLPHDIRSTYRRTVALLEHERLQLELDLVSL